MKAQWVIVLCIAVALAAFYGGMAYGQSSAAPQAQTAARGAGAGGLRLARGGQGGGFVGGTVSSVDSTSLTLSLPGGNSMIVFYSTSTAITKPAPAAASDLVSGSRVLITGTPNSDGSFTAQTIQVRPADGRG